jgi:hypothetical protein
VKVYCGVDHGEGGESGLEDVANRVAFEDECKEKVERLLQRYIPGVQVVVRVRPAHARRGSLHRTHRPASSTTANQSCELPSGGSDSDFQAADARGPLCVSIRVPAAYFKKKWRNRGVLTGSNRRNVEARAVEEIKRLAASALPPMDGVLNPEELVTVLRLPDAPVAAKTEQAETPPALAWKAEYWTVPCVLFMAVGCYVVFRRMRERSQSASAEAPMIMATRVPSSSNADLSDSHDGYYGIELDGQLASRLMEHRQASLERAESPRFEFDAPSDSGETLFEELFRCEPATLQYLGDAAGPELLALALIGAPLTIIDRMLDGVSRECAKSTERVLRELGPVRLSDVDTARRQLNQLLSGRSEAADWEPQMSADER